MSASPQDVHATPSTRPDFSLPLLNRVQTPEDNPWLFTAEEVKETPSRVQDLPEGVETKVVAKTAQFLQECGRKLTIPQLTVSVAIKLFQRFFMLESMLVYQAPLVAAACLFLSCKVQETHKRLRDIIYCTVKVRTRDTPDFPDGMDMYEDSAGYFDEKNSILDKERDVLRVLNFDLTVDHPYKHLWTLTSSYLPNGHTRRSVTQAAWNFLNDSFRTYIHVRYDSREIATAALFLATKLLKYHLPDGSAKDPTTGKRLLAWHELFRVDLYRIEEICTSLLDMYEMEDKTAHMFRDGPGVLHLHPTRPAKRIKLSPST